MIANQNDIVDLIDDLVEFEDHIEKIDSELLHPLEANSTKFNLVKSDLLSSRLLNELKKRSHHHRVWHILLLEAVYGNEWFEQEKLPKSYIHLLRGDCLFSIYKLEGISPKINDIWRRLIVSQLASSVGYSNPVYRSIDGRILERTVINIEYAIKIVKAQIEKIPEIKSKIKNGDSKYIEKQLSTIERSNVTARELLTLGISEIKTIDFENGIRSIPEFISITNNIANSQSNTARNRMKGVHNPIYRGESASYITPLLPTLLRDFLLKGYKVINQADVGKIMDQLQKAEVEHIRRFQQSSIGKTLLIEYPILTKNGEPNDHVVWWFLTQHYGSEGDPRFKTRLLDVSKNPLVALYFAVQGSEDEYGWVFTFSEFPDRLGNPDLTFLDHLIPKFGVQGEGLFQFYDPDRFRSVHIAFPRLDKQGGKFLFLKFDSNLFEGINHLQIVPPTTWEANAIKIDHRFKGKIREELASIGVNGDLEK